MKLVCIFALFPFGAVWVAEKSYVKQQTLLHRVSHLQNQVLELFTQHALHSLISFILPVRKWKMPFIIWNTRRKRKNLDVDNFKHVSSAVPPESTFPKFYKHQRLQRGTMLVLKRYRAPSEQRKSCQWERSSSVRFRHPSRASRWVVEAAERRRAAVTQPEMILPALWHHDGRDLQTGRWQRAPYVEIYFLIGCVWQNGEIANVKFSKRRE